MLLVISDLRVELSERNEKKNYIFFAIRLRPLTEWNLFCSYLKHLQPVCVYCMLCWDDTSFIYQYIDSDDLNVNNIYLKTMDRQTFSFFSKLHSINTKTSFDLSSQKVYTRKTNGSRLLRRFVEFIPCQSVGLRCSFSFNVEKPGKRIANSISFYFSMKKRRRKLFWIANHFDGK